MLKIIKINQNYFKRLYTTKTCVEDTLSPLLNERQNRIRFEKIGPLNDLCCPREKT